MDPGNGLEVQTEVYANFQHVILYEMEMWLTSEGKHNAGAIHPIPVRAPGPKDVPVAARLEAAAQHVA